MQNRTTSVRDPSVDHLALDAFVATLRTHRQFLAAFAATCAQYVATIRRRHALAEAVLVAALPDGGLESPFHRA